MAQETAGETVSGAEEVTTFGVGPVVAWVGAIFSFLMAYGSAMDSYTAPLGFIALGGLMIPGTRRRLKEDYGIAFTRTMLVVIYFVGMFVITVVGAVF